MQFPLWGYCTDAKAISVFDDRHTFSDKDEEAKKDFKRLKVS